MRSSMSISWSSALTRSRLAGNRDSEGISVAQSASVTKQFSSITS